MEINIPTGPDILRDIAIQYVNKPFVHITDCNPPLKGGMGNRGIGEWKIGESGDRETGEPGNHGTGE